MIRPVRALAIILAASLSIPTVFGQEPAEPSAVVCPDGLTHMEGVGLVCPRGHGLYEVYNAQLESLGYTHGTDPVPADAQAEPDPFDAATGTSVNCVGGAAGTYYVRVIYARATDDADGYASWVGTIRSLVGQANQLVDDAAIATGSTASLNVKCVSGVVEVVNAVLPTPKASASFSTIVTDLRNMGYNDGKVKHWVFYDDTGACSCGGTGHVYNDDSPGVTNLNNGNGVSLFAVNFGYNSVRIMLHELGHNLGAVQNSAPRSTGALHCYDGRDTMCYNDGGPNGHLYSTGYCATEVFDCGKNDYFHANPPSGSYLATKWNLGNPVNRYITFGTVSGAPTLTSLTCPPSVEEDAPFACTFLASSGTASGVRFTIAWGDGTTTPVPTSGYVAPGTTQSASHAYATPGTRTVTVSVVDSNGLNGNSLSTSVNAFADNPVMDLLSCPASVEEDAPFSCSFRASDGSPGVRYTLAWGDGTTTTVPATGTVAPGVTQSATKTYPTPGTRTVTVTATDTYGHVSAPLGASVDAFADAPVINLLSCPVRAEEDFVFACSFRASDQSPGVYYTIAWGDGTTTRVPATGTVAPGVMQSASKAFSSPATYTVKVTATDTYGHASLASAVNVLAFEDDPYIATLLCPASVEANRPFSCQVSARDNSSGVKYTIDWGDGSPATTIPSSGYQSPNSTQTLAHTYATLGTRTIVAQATDSLGHVGPARAASVQVVLDATPPTLTIDDPRANFVYVGCGVARAAPVATTGRALWVETACVRVSASDAVSGVKRVEVYVDGVLRASDSAAPYVMEFPVPTTKLNAQVVVRAYDHAGNVAVRTTSVDMAAL